jgi:hypothetical protein
MNDKDERGKWTESVKKEWCEANEWEGLVNIAKKKAL